MKKRTLTLCLLLCLLLAVLCPVLSSCGGESTTTLYVYNWGEYISDGSDDTLDTNAEFEAYYYELTGKRVTVNYSTFSSVEDMYAKVSSGSTAYDVIIPSDYMIERMVKEELLLPLDMEKIPNYEFLSETFRKENVYYEGDNPDTYYSVPYFYGMLGVIYNTTIVDEEDVADESWDLMWNEKYKGDILQFNNSRDAFGTALLKLGYSLNESTEDEWYEALDLLKEQKEILQGYVMDEIYNKMQSGSSAVSSYYAGDFFTMYEENEDLAFYYPAEGTNYYVDAMCIPYNAKHYDLALEYINFMCRPDIAFANAEYTYYASPLDLAAWDDLDALPPERRELFEEYAEDMEEYRECMEEIHEDAWDFLYGERSVAALENPGTQYYHNLPDDKLVLLNNLWEVLKSESKIGVGIYVGCGLIVAALIALAVYHFVKKYRWSKLYD